MSAPIDSLKAAFSAQLQLQIQSYGKNPQILSDEDRIEFIRWNVLALEDELHEALGECGWKPWASSRHVNTDAFHSEMVDVFHFFINLCLATGMSADMLLEGYAKKREKNAARQSEGYDGVANKCPKCRRALDDDFTECVYNSNTGRGVCSVVGPFYHQ